MFESLEIKHGKVTLIVNDENISKLHELAWDELAYMLGACLSESGGPLLLLKLVQQGMYVQNHGKAAMLNHDTLRKFLLDPNHKKRRKKLGSSIITLGQDE